MMPDIHHLAMHGKNTELEVLLENPDIDVNAKGFSTKTTPLILACEGGYLSTAQLLLSKGANPSLANKNGRTALHVALDGLEKQVKGKRQLGKVVDEELENSIKDLDLIINLLLQRAPNLISLPAFAGCDRNIFELIDEQNVKIRIRQIIEEIDPSHPLLLSAKTSAKPQAAIAAPTREETPIVKPVTPEPPSQSGLRHRPTKTEEQPPSVEMTAGTSSKRPRTGSKPTSPRSSSLLSSIQAFFGFDGSSKVEYQRLPASAPDELQSHTTTATPTKD